MHQFFDEFYIFKPVLDICQIEHFLGADEGTLIRPTVRKVWRKRVHEATFCETCAFRVVFSPVSDGFGNNSKEILCHTYRLATVSLL